MKVLTLNIILTLAFIANLATAQAQPRTIAIITSIPLAPIKMHNANAALHCQEEVELQYKTNDTLDQGITQKEYDAMMQECIDEN